MDPSPLLLILTPRALIETRLATEITKSQKWVENKQSGSLKSNVWKQQRGTSLARAEKIFPSLKDCYPRLTAPGSDDACRWHWHWPSVVRVKRLSRKSRTVKIPSMMVKIWRWLWRSFPIGKNITYHWQDVGGWAAGKLPMILSLIIANIPNGVSQVDPAGWTRESQVKINSHDCYAHQTVTLTVTLTFGAWRHNTGSLAVVSFLP